MELQLSAAEARVLGALVEKDAATPEYYPLSLNALGNACNQKSSRDPVMTLSEDEVRQALHSLNEKGLAGAVSSAESRVPKYEHRLQEAFNFTRGETAIVCVLLLRGPQTPGELRTRTERLHRFAELADVHSTLQALMQRQPPLVKMLSRQSGTKEARYVQLLAADAEAGEAAPLPVNTAFTRAADERIAALEEAVRILDQRLAELQQQVSSFRKQFE
jgi:uncharacterized protein YceH (UPF0502 family)